MIKLSINGAIHEIDDPNMPLLWAIREQAGLTGTKFGCGAGLCGCCTVHIDGEAVRSCITPAGDAVDKSVTTIEGLASGGVPHPLQEAFVAENVPQCGYCQSGQIMAAAAFLQENPSPTDEEIREGMGNLCRCGTYLRIQAAIARAARTGTEEKL
ncbi:Isoquinoline 1-oxidoreductase subunit alpha [Marinovum algicola]|uniref:Isoquinoline 1-oxidoreductase, alpha subunit n=1 Tax=Marinovum algicola TaxID=42444 RepID=A0A975ZQT7_9RHOB|nr:(2Fe-2S)-binding protein [Marinovum algicola]SEK09045.1 isoquinoline 1-oxidoreductase, alpha subunit [Marinovum algicola]SLN71761.1 Isoquinoline 1-oxidoreductase subunit alpha [Marinovum algicola]